MATKTYTEEETLAYRQRLLRRYNEAVRLDERAVLSGYNNEPQEIRDIMDDLIARLYKRRVEHKIPQNMIKRTLGNDRTKPRMFAVLEIVDQCTSGKFAYLPNNCVIGFEHESDMTMFMLRYSMLLNKV